MFSGLYFYIQNIRIILTSPNDLKSSFFSTYGVSVRVSPLLLVMGASMYFFLLTGFLFLDDLILTLIWLLA